MIGCAPGSVMRRLVHQRHQAIHQVIETVRGGDALDLACGQGRHPGPVYSSRRATNALAGAMWRASRNISKSDAQPEMAFSPEIG